jgi:hypothetical protein
MTRPFRLAPPQPSEADVKAGCMTILDLHHYFVVRLHAGTFQTLDCQRKLRGVTKGTPDFGCFHGSHRNFLLEVKRPGGELSVDQEIQIQVLREQFGLPIVVVETVEGLCNFLAQHERSP